MPRFRSASIQSEVSVLRRADRAPRRQPPNRARAALRDDAGRRGARRRGRGSSRERRARDPRRERGRLEAATGRLDEGTLDRLRLDDGAGRGARRARSRRWRRSSRSSARRARGRSPNGLRVSERRIPIGTVGANFEARPNVALDVAGQLLKSLNTAVLRTGGAALAHRDRARRRGAAPGARGGRAAGGRGRARPLARPRGRPRPRLAAAADPARHPARQRRDDGGARAARRRARRPDARARRGRRRPLRPRLRRRRRRRSRSPRRASTGSASATGSTSRSSTATRRPRCRRSSSCFARAGLEVRGDGRRRRSPLDRPLGYEWASDPERVATVTVDVVDGLDEAVRARERGDLGPRRRDRRRGRGRRPSASSTATAARPRSGTRPTRFTDGFELTGAPETGINVDWTPGPRGPVTYRDLWLRQYRVVGDGHSEIGRLTA